MELTRDELAGIAGLFGGLSRPDLRQACEEVVFKRTGDAPGTESVDERIDAALHSHHLVALPGDSEEVIVSGPTAFPSIPDGAEDLPHILDVPERSIDRETVAERVLTDVSSELEEQPDARRRVQLRQLAYDLETWAAVDTSPIRDRLDGLEE